MGCLEVEQASVEYSVLWHMTKVSFNHFGIRVECCDDLAGGVPRGGIRIADLVQDNDIGKLDLIDQQVN